jgi:hypothetical protein
MPQLIRHPVGPVAHSTWIVPIVAGILIGCLLAVIANSLKEMRWTSGAVKAPSAVAASDPKRAVEVRKPVRYEAVRSNWKQYRESQAPQ